MFPSMIGATGSAFLLAAVASAFHHHPSRPISTIIPSRRLHNIMSTRSRASAIGSSNDDDDDDDDGDDDGDGGPLPELVVFDLDACFWDKEMYTLSKIPNESDIVRGDLNGRGVGVISVMSGRTRISLHDGSLLALQNHADGKYPNTKICFASSADTEHAENIGRATLKLLEVIPGITVWDLVVNRDWDGIDVNQIGRRHPLSANKSATHFPILRELTRVRYDRMLFFDDCQWGDHCGQVERACKESNTGKGPVTIRTPCGLGVEEWEDGLEKYAKSYQALDGIDNYDIKKK